MSSRWHAAVPLLALCAALCACKQQRPVDVVLIVVDTLRADALGCYGAEPSPTPHMDRLASQGARFAAATATSSWTGATVASLTTGRYPDELGFRSKKSGLPTGVPNLAETLGAAGYQTLAVVSNGVAGPKFGHDRGYDAFAFEPYKTSAGDRRPAFTAERVTDRALETWRTRDDERPTFLHVHYTDPHDPYLPPARWRRHDPPLDDGYLLEQRYRFEDALTPDTLSSLRASYLGEVAFVDDEIGRLLEAIGPKAVVVLVSDHGEEFLEHEGFHHGTTLYEELVSVPLLIRAPAVPAGVVVPTPASQVDVFPTLLELTGVPSPDGASLSGESLMPRLAGSGGEPRPVASILGGTKDWISVRHGRWKLHARGPDEPPTLYDLEADPGETRSVAAEQAEALRSLQAWWDRRARLVGPGIVDEGQADLADRLEALEAMGYLR
jgi:arylsulfatase A-like enzyme